MRLVVAGFLFVLPSVALAQGISPQMEAMQQEIGMLETAKLNWQAQAIAEKRRADDLQKQLDAARKPTEAPSK
jgi:hypothetical protein